MKQIYEALARALHSVAGIRLHQGKTRVWNKAGTQPEDVDTLGENAWQPGRVMVLGTPIGHEQFTRDKLHARVRRCGGCGEDPTSAGFTVYMVDFVAKAPARDRTTHCALSHQPWQLSTATSESVGGHPRK